MAQNNPLQFQFNVKTINYINIFFGVELILKIIADGFYIAKHSFLRNPLNIYDSIIILHDLIYYNFSIKNEIWLFPLRCISTFLKLKILGLQKILLSIFLSLKLTGQVFFVVLLFCYIYSLFGLYLFSGLFKKTCFSPLTGFKSADGSMCGNLACAEGYVCGKLIASQYDESNFDNLLFSFMMILRILTLDSWNSVQNLCQQTFTNYIWVYFFSFIFFGNYFLINIFLAVEKINYTKMLEQTENSKQIFQNERDKEYNLKEFKILKSDSPESVSGQNDKERPHRFETIVPSSFGTKKSNKMIHVSRLNVGSHPNSKEFATKISRKEFLFKKVSQRSQKINEISSSENSKPSTKLYDFEKNVITLEKTPTSNALKHKKKGMIMLKKTIKCLQICCLKIINPLIDIITLNESEFLDAKNLTVFVMKNKKFYGNSTEDVLPLK